MSDAASMHPDPIEPPDAEGSTPTGDLPTNPIMAALHRAASEDSGRRRNWLLGIADDSAGRPHERPDEIAELTERLAAAEKRAEEAEGALPHLMELGQKTVDGLLNDARRRGREIIEASRERAEQEFAATRDEARKEARELDALRMAVAAEAMGLEQIRAELQRRISSSAAELTRMAEHPRLLGGQLPVEELGLAAPTPAALAVAPAASEVDDAEVIDAEVVEIVTADPVVAASTTPSAAVEAQIEIAGAAEATLDVSRSSSVPADLVDDADAPAPPADPNSPFATAWAADEDEDAAEAFDRFFSADVEYEPSREWILADDTRD